VAQWNQTEKILQAKVVYYGPALSGKTTNLRQIHRITDPRNENRLISLNTSSDRTLFFDLLPLDLGRISGHSVKVQLYTVPGQVRYDATRRVVLSGADAVVFVADSGPGKGAENRAAWENLKTNLKANGLDPSIVPIVIQYNKQDLDIRLTPKEIESAIRSGMEGVSASALTGPGVMETFRLAVLMMLRRLSVLTGRRRAEDLAELEEQAAQAIDRCMARGSTGTRPEAEEIGPPGLQTESTTIRFGEGATEDLLARSLQANLGIAEQFAEMRDLKIRLQRRIGELEELQGLTRELSKHSESSSVVEDLAEAALSTPGAKGVSFLARKVEGAPLTATVLKNLRHDPLLAGVTGPTAADEILRRGEAILLDRLPAPAHLSLVSSSDMPATAIAVPMFPVLRPPCLLMVYGGAPFGPDDARFLSLLASHAAVCLDNVTMTRRLTLYNERLEKEVRERTKDLEKANEDLRQLDQMKDRFLSSVSHEMKTPLTGIISGAELLASLTPPEDERREFVGMIAEEGRRLAALVDQILRFQILGRKSPENAEPATSVSSVVHRVVADVTPVAEARKVEIGVAVPDGIPLAFGDPESWVVALREILDNAVKFSPAGGRVDVDVRMQDGTQPQDEPAGALADAPSFDGKKSAVVISVRDQGPGIPAEQHDKIFERFEQLGNVLTSKPMGLGLGLPIARDIARKQGGELRIESAPGQGSVFILLLPVEAAPAPVGPHLEVVDERR
jgi:signal transduction histidine kinase